MLAKAARNRRFRMNGQRAFQQLKQGAQGLLATMHSRAREIRGDLSCTSMHFQALSCNGRLPKR